MRKSAEWRLVWWCVMALIELFSNINPNIYNYCHSSHYLLLHIPLHLPIHSLQCLSTILIQSVAFKAEIIPSISYYLLNWRLFLNHYLFSLLQAKSKRELVAFLLSDFLLLTTPNKSVASCTTLAMLERALTSTTCTMYRKVRQFTVLALSLMPWCGELWERKSIIHTCLCLWK